MRLEHPGHEKCFVDGLNVPEKQNLSTLMGTAKCHGAKGFENKIPVHAPAKTGDIGLEKEKNTNRMHRAKMVLSTEERILKGPVKGSDRIYNIMFKTKGGCGASSF